MGFFDSNAEVSSLNSATPGTRPLTCHHAAARQRRDYPTINRGTAARQRGMYARQDADDGSVALGDQIATVGWLELT